MIFLAEGAAMAIGFSPIWSPKLVQAARPTRMQWLCPMGVIRGPGFWPRYARDHVPEVDLTIRMVCGRSQQKGFR